MRVLITGASGFIGGAVARRLLARGDTVVALVRPGKKPERIARLRAAGIDVREGDVRDAESVQRAAAGCDMAVHSAGHPRPGSWRTFRAVHVEGTRNVVEASRRAGVRRMVNIASQAALFAGKDLVGKDETCPYPTRHIDPYSATKAEAERVALAANDPGRLEVTSLRPAVVWGRGDTTILPVLVRLARGPLGVPMCGDGRNIEATTHIENLVDAVLAALTAPAAPGRTYLINDGFTITWRELIERMLAAAGVRARFVRVPRGLAVGAAWTIDRAAGLLGLPVPLALFGVRSAMTSRSFDNTRARTELGYVPRIGLEDGLADLAAWVREIGGAGALIGRRGSVSAAPVQAAP